MHIDMVKLYHII